MKYLILIFFIALSCKSTQSNQSDTEENEQGVFQEIGREVTDEMVLITLRNTSDVSQLILNPLEKFIEQKIDEKWVKVSVLYCDCGGPPCPAPPSEIEVEANGTFKFRWDLIVEECRSDANGRTTFKTKASKGLYKAMHRFKSNGGEIETMFVNFELN